MTGKLTLSINQSIIDNSKIAARKSGVSLSRLVEKYLKNLAKTKNQQQLSPITAELLGLAKTDNKPDPKKLKKSYLEKKYL